MFHFMFLSTSTVLKISGIYVCSAAVIILNMQMKIKLFCNIICVIMDSITWKYIK